MMSRIRPAARAPLSWSCLIAAVALVGPSAAVAARIVLLDGRVMEGRHALLSSTVETPKAGINPKNLVMVDDGLRRTIFPQRQVREVNELDSAEPPESFDVPQQVSESGVQVAAVGPILATTPFDDFGRRILTMSSSRGVEQVIQGITQITPEWTRLECVDAPSMHFVWDMRVATTSIPRDVLGRILHKAIDPQNLDHRLKIVRLYMQSKRFDDAEEELQGVLKGFPNLTPDQKRVFEQTAVRLKQTQARRMLEEIETRRKAGQHFLCRSLLQRFPTEQVAGETLQSVRQMLEEYDAVQARCTKTLARLAELLSEVRDTATRTRLAAIFEEIKAELNIHTLDRMAAFLQFEAAAELTADEKIALAVSGWLIGTDAAVRNLPTSLSMADTRDLLRKYLAEPSRLERDQLLASLRKQEAFEPEKTAKLLGLMTPPFPVPAPDEKVVGMYRLQVDNLTGEPPIDYLVQLPREYDPHRRYPVIVTLHSAGSTPEQQLDWWAGGVGPGGERIGHAERNGYIVVAPSWAKIEQQDYFYSEQEHAGVMLPLRDVFRRFSVDTDRVFITGHSMGGDAAWDIAISHPDMFAGHIGINATAGRFTNYYKVNAKYVPFYLVCGEKDGKLWVDNQVQVDTYLTRGDNATVVQYRGRGHEHFSDELIRLFDWMGRQQRDLFPKQVDCFRVRPFDFFFYWITADDLPARAMVDPMTGPPKGFIADHIAGEVNVVNNVRADTLSGAATVWLSPELINFKLPCIVTINGKRANRGSNFIEPDAAVMIEDARARSDRQHPFWAKVELTK